MDVGVHETKMLTALKALLESASVALTASMEVLLTVELLISVCA